MDSLSDTKDGIGPNAENVHEARKHPTKMIIKEDTENLSVVKIELCQILSNISEYAPNLINLLFHTNQFSDLSNFLNMIKKLAYPNPNSNEHYFALNKIYELNNLSKLSTCKYPLGEIQNELSNTLNLEISNISRNQLTDLKKSKTAIACMKNFEELNACIASIPMMPKEINVYSNLYDINISSNNIYFLPEEICLLKHLNTLILDKNFMTNLPENIGQLASLRRLKIRDNKLRKLPESIQLLQKLEYIDLYSNELSLMPDVIPELMNLVGLDLEQNYFSTEHLKYIGCPNYEAMRQNLKNIWSDIQFGYESICGYKSNLYPDEKESLLESCSSSSSSLEEESNMIVLPPETYNELLEESWDTSDNSADEFDPNESRPPKKRPYPPFTFFKPYQQIYCPADSHKARVITKVRQMLKDKSLVWSSIYEDGQFDDA